MDPKIAAATVQYIAVTSALVQKQAEESLRLKKQEKEAKAKFASVLDHLVNTGCVSATQKQAALEQISNHATALDMLVNATTKLQQYKEAIAQERTKQASELGQPDSIGKNEKKASNSLSSPFVGRFSSEPLASDNALRAILNNPT